MSDRELDYYWKIVREFILPMDQDKRESKYNAPYITNNGGHITFTDYDHPRKLQQPKLLLLITKGDEKLAQKLHHGLVDRIWDRQKDSSISPSEWLYKQVTKEGKR